MTAPDLTPDEAATVARFGLDKPERRTKRRYAHELYPHAAEGETRPLAVEVPYLYARASGLDIIGTSWTEAEPRSAAGERISLYLEAARIAFLADALAQGMTGDEAWKWADERTNEESGQWVWEGAEHYGVNPDLIKPYPCGPEPAHHDHYDEPDANGWRTVHRIAGRESECEDCTDPVDPVASTGHTATEGETDEN